MIVHTFCSKSEPHKVDKVLIPLVSLEVVFREGSSIIDPSLLIEMETPVVNVDGVDYTVNYIYIPNFNRYYFVNNISVNRTRLWQFDCHCDVLSTFKDEWKRLPCIVARNEFKYNLFLPDDRFLVNSNRFVQSVKFPNNPIVSAGGSSYVMTIAGGSTTSATSEVTT